MLHEEAMIVRLSISHWTARKFDKKVTDEVAKMHGVPAEAGRYNKVLIHKEAIAEITTAVSSARTFHYQNTLPWDDGGGRILPSKNFLTYSKEMRKLKQRFDDAVARFIDNYDDYREVARRKLNGMFRESDYPGRREIGHKFNFATDIEPVPTAADFRVSMGSKDMQRIQKQLEKRTEQRVAEATRDLFVRLNEVIGKFAEAMREEDKIFRDSKVENIVELVNILPKLNISNDPELDKLRKETAKKLASLEPDNLRADKDARAQAANDADAILKKMAGYMKR